MARARVEGATTTLYLRGMPAAVVREAKAEAARRGVTIAGLVAAALEQATSARPRASRSTPLRQDAAWFEKHRARLISDYRGEYLAIVDACVVDHDRDLDTLVRRVGDRYGARMIFMPRAVERGEERTKIRLRTPRIRRTGAAEPRFGPRAR